MGEGEREVGEGEREGVMKQVVVHRAGNGIV